MVDTIAKQGGDPYLYLSHSQDAKKNPLSYEDKVYWCDKAFGDRVNVVNSSVRNMYEAAKELNDQGYTDLVYICGSDRSDEAQRMKDYNGKKDKNGNLVYQFDSISFVKAGEDRVEESDDIDITKVSASRQRAFAEADDLEGFMQGCPSRLTEEECEELFNDVRKGMGLFESLDEVHLEEASQLTKSSMQKPEVQQELDKKLAHIKPGFDVPDPDKDITAYKRDPGDYQGLFVKGKGDVCFSVKDAANYAQEQGANPANAVRDLDDLTVKDNKGKEYELHQSSSSILAKGSSRSANVTLGSNLQDLQEAVQAALLMNLVKVDGDVVQFLLNSDPIKKSGIFKVVVIPDIEQDDLQIFQEEWSAFVKTWKQSFINCVNNSGALQDTIKNEAGVPGGYITLHQSIRNKYRDAVYEFFNNHAKDNVDKSDFYVYSELYAKDIVKDFSTLNSLISEPKEYVHYWGSIKDKLIGVSLKKSGKEQVIDFDEKPLTAKDVESTGEWRVSKSASGVASNNLLFVVKDNKKLRTLALMLRPAGKGNHVMEFMFAGDKAAAGKAKNAAHTLLGDEGDDIISTVNADKYTLASSMLLKLICNKVPKTPNDGDRVKFELSDYGRKTIANLFDASAGRSKGPNRTSVPYIKVH